jgi:dally-like protein
LQVKKNCGSPKLLMKDGVSTTVATREEVTSPRGVPTSPSWEPEDKSELQLQLEAFLESSNKARGFYANLAEALCSDESFAETRDTADCWNGHRVGE